jgi:hypothetical protein
MMLVDFILPRLPAFDLTAIEVRDPRLPDVFWFLLDSNLEANPRIGLSGLKPGGTFTTCLQGYTDVAVGIQGVTLYGDNCPQNHGFAGIQKVSLFGIKIARKFIGRQKWLLQPLGQVHDE